MIKCDKLVEWEIDFDKVVLMGWLDLWSWLCFDFEKGILIEVIMEDEIFEDDIFCV